MIQNSTASLIHSNQISRISLCGEKMVLKMDGTKMRICDSDLVIGKMRLNASFTSIYLWIHLWTRSNLNIQRILPLVKTLLSQICYHSDGSAAKTKPNFCYRPCKKAQQNVFALYHSYNPHNPPGMHLDFRLSFQDCRRASPALFDSHTM